jgi:formate-dependent nitrite reductase membrane component NrfD
LLIWDLEHPELFHLNFTRPQWRSWLVKGAFIIAGYTLVLALHFIASWVGARSVQRWLMIPGIPLSILTAIYTAYLFAQAKARDMWQNPLLPPHLVFQAALLGSAVLLPIASMTWNSAGFLLLWILAITSVIHLLMVWGEVSLTHPTAHARLAIWEMVKGRYKNDFWGGTILSVVGALLPLLAVLGVVNISIGVAAAPFALIGLMLFENAYVQAAQAVPLA